VHGPAIGERIRREPLVVDGEGREVLTLIEYRLNAELNLEHDLSGVIALDPERVGQDRLGSLHLETSNEPPHLVFYANGESARAECHLSTVKPIE